MNIRDQFRFGPEHQSGRFALLCYADDGAADAGGGGGGDVVVADPVDEPSALGAAAAAAAAAEAGKTDDNKDKPAVADADKGDADKGKEADAEADKDKAKDGDGEKDKDESDAPGDDALDAAKLKPPEGSEALDPEALEEFLPLAKELGIETNAGAQKLVDLAGKMIARQSQAAQTATTEKLKGIFDGWKDKAAKDAEIGGADHKQKLGVALRGLEKYGTPELMAFLDESKLGSNPEFVRLAYRIGLTVKEDAGLIRGDKAKGGTPSINQQWGWKDNYQVGVHPSQQSN